MKKIFILFPILTLLVAGCSLTQKPVVDNSVPNQPVSVSQEQTNNLNAQIQEAKKEEIGKQVKIPAETQLKKFVREKYSFYAPKEWMESSVILSGGNSSGCELYSINYGGDGHRTGGSIDIRTKSCFASLNLTSPINSNKENTEKNGYYIVAMYDSLTGTTPSEESKTKEVYKKVVETFTLNMATLTINIKEDSISNDSQTFNLSVEGISLNLGLSSYSSHLTLADDKEFPTRKTSVIQIPIPGTYKISETQVANFTTTWICSPGPEGEANYSGTGNVTVVDIGAGKSITCTFTNTEKE